MEILTVAIVSAALLGMLLRPLRVHEAWWAAGGAVLLVLSGALAPGAAADALLRGVNVYLFLIGMMALAEFAREEGMFDWIATHAVRAAGASRMRLLALVFVAGIGTTAFLSNDATIVVLTPAVLSALARTDAVAEPYVVACALVANAASLLLPIANPSNLLFFSGGIPPLGAWFASFGLASVAALALTFAALALRFRGMLTAPLHAQDGLAAAPRRSASALLAIAAMALVATASLGLSLGVVACGFGAVATLFAATRERTAPLAVVRGISWGVVVLTAGLFVLVEGLDAAGAAALPRDLFAWADGIGAPWGQAAVAAATAAASNILTNLPVGLDVGHFAATVHQPRPLVSAALVGVNVGPNFTTNGSLATFLWLAILRRAGVAMSPLRFAAIGLAVTPAALIAAALLTH